MPWTGGGLTVSGPVIEVLYVEHCPCVSAALSLVRRVCAELGLDAEVRSILIPDQAAAERARFLGSPTVRVAGRDVEPGVELAAEYTLECRLYRHEHRLAGYPQERWVREPSWRRPAGPDQAAARRRGQAGIVLLGSLT